MWVDADEFDDEMLHELSATLVDRHAVAATPSTAELQLLHHAVAQRFRATPPAVVRPIRRPAGRRIGRVGVAAAGIVLLSASAAAATGGVPLPRPVRAFAHAVGLPVDSPAVDETHHHLRALDDAVQDGDAQRARDAARRLRAAVTQVPDDERAEVQADVQQALAEAAVLLVGESGSSPPATTSPSGATEEGGPTTSTAPRPGNTGSPDTGEGGMPEKGSGSTLEADPVPASPAEAMDPAGLDASAPDRNGDGYDTPPSAPPASSEADADPIEPAAAPADDGTSPEAVNQEPDTAPESAEEPAAGNDTTAAG